jgi:hypothetical protein
MGLVEKEAVMLTRRQLLGHAMIILGGGGGLGLFGCDEKPGPFWQSISAAAGERPKSDETEGIVRKKLPAEFELKLSGQLQIDLENVIGRDPPGSISYTLTAVPPKNNRVVEGLDIYVNVPSRVAPPQLSPESKYFVESKSFQPSGKSPKPQSFNGDLTETLVRLFKNNEWSPKDPIKFTILPVAAEAHELPDDLAIPVRISVWTPK